MPANDYNTKLDTDINTNTQPLSIPVTEAVRGRQRLLGIVLIIIGLVWLVNSMLPMAFDSIFGNERSSSFDQRYNTQHIILDAASSHVILRDADDQQVRVRFEQDSSEQEAVQIVEDGNILRISQQLTPCFFCDDTLYEIDVPANIQIEVNSISGDIEAYNLMGTFSIVSQSGDIMLQNLQGNVHASSSSGDIKVKQSNLEDATIETTSGKIEFSGSSAKMLSKSVSGDIKIENDIASQFMLSTASGDLTYIGQPASASDVTTISGDVKLTLSPESNISLSLSTVSGDIKNNIDLIDLIKNPQALSGKLGDGTVTLYIHSTSSDIQISLR